MKQCFKCGETKPLDEFYKHSQMADGHLNKCKECAKRDVSANYRVRKPQYQAYYRERSSRPERKAYEAARQRLRQQLKPEKHRAWQAVKRAVRTGRLIKQPCEVCGATRQVEAHHPDYSKPLDVRWLCFAHHRAEHGQEVTPQPVTALLAA